MVVVWSVMSSYGCDVEAGVVADSVRTDSMYDGHMKNEERRDTTHTTYRVTYHE